MPRYEKIKIETGAVYESSAEDTPYVIRPKRYWTTIGRYSLFILVFTLPWFFLPWTTAPVATGKHLAAAFLITIAFVCFLASVIEGRRLTYPSSRLGLGVLALLAVSGLAAIFSKSQITSLYGGLSRSDSFFDIIIFSLAFFLAFYFWREEDIGKIARLFLWGVALLDIYGLSQAFGKFLLPWGFTKDAGFNVLGSLSSWGALLAATLVLAAVLPFGRLKKIEKALVVIFILISAAGLLILNYQYLWLLTAVVLVVVAGLRFVSGSPMRLPVLLALLAIFLAIISPYLPQFASLPTEVRPSFSETFSVARHTIWGWRFFFGSGPSMFADDFALFRSSGLNQVGLWNLRFNQGYDLPVTLLSTTGILGLLAFLFLIAVFLNYMPRASEVAGRNGTPLMIAVFFLILQLFFYPAFFAQLMFIFLGLGLIAALSSGRKEIVFSQSNPTTAFPAFVIVMILIGLTLAAAYFIGQKYVAAAEYANAVSAANSGDIQGGLQSLNGAVGLDGQVDDYWRILSQTFLLQASRLISFSGGKSSDQLSGAITNAYQAANQAAALNPASSLNWVNLATICENLIPVASQADYCAATNYKKAAGLDPQNPDIPTAIARVLVGQGQKIAGSDSGGARQKMDEAVSWLEKAIALKFDYAPARFLLAQIYLIEGDSDNASRVLGEIEALRPNDQGLAYQVGLFYYQNGQNDKAQTELERAVSLDPNYANARYVLSLVYSKEGLKDKAAAELNKVLETNPGNADIQKLLDSLKKESATPIATSSPQRIRNP